MEVAELDNKRRAASEKVALTFRTKKISLVLLDEDILQELHKFPFPIQKLIGNEALAVNDRLEKGKPPPNLLTAECHCRFFVRYLLPCHHVFHEHMFGQCHDVRSRPSSFTDDLKHKNVGLVRPIDTLLTMSDSNKGDCNLADYCLARRDIYTCGKYTMLVYLLCAIRLCL